jgi:hypothetical protein
MWDVNVATLDEEQYADYVIERFLELGDFDEIRWLIDRYGWQRVRDFMRGGGHRLTPGSASFWSRVFEAAPENERRPQFIPFEGKTRPRTLSPEAARKLLGR